MVLIAYPDARLDYSEIKMCVKEPCWFIQKGWQGPYLMRGFAKTPREAWKLALQQITVPVAAKK
jgi:hypothetical protein